MSEQITRSEIAEYQLLLPLMEGILNEMRELSKKKQDGVLNKLKAKTINKILDRIKVLLKDEPSLEFLERLDEDTLPTNSDAVLIIVQFKSAMAGYSKKRHKIQGMTSVWNIKED